ncbi:ABC transporter permease [Bombiscardovia nodaiensis]|uniref:ABC transporter permease n=1 Tax=Bombiscardovia nodaiensis TaxID=2932181 RepID=A0ABN6SCB4_9BIFI|nr:ABC transporter permease [Bombiscardovia nodaiensis]
MWSISWKMMKRDVRMLVPAGIAILVGSLFIAATFLFGNTLDNSMRKQVSSAFGSGNYAIAPENISNSGEVKTIKDFHLSKLRTLPAVKGARPDVNVFAQVGKTGGGKHTDTAVISMVEPDSLMPISLVEGRWPAAEGETTVPKSVADRLDTKVGGSISFNSAMEAEGSGGSPSASQLKIVGIDEDIDGYYSYYGGASVVTESTLTKLMGPQSDEGEGQPPVAYVYLLLDESQTSESNLKQIRDEMPKGYKLQTRAEFENAQLKSLSGQTSIMTTFLLSFGVLAMFVAALVIANTFQVIVARQRRTLALLRTIGAKKSQVRSSVLMQSSILGLVASALGTLLAIGLVGLAQVLKLRMGGLSFTLKVTPLVILVPIAFGTLITMLASMSSARAATRVTPLEALRPPELSEEKRSGRVRIVISCLLILLGAAMAGYVVYQAVLDSRGVKGTFVSGDTSSFALATAVGGVAIVFIGVLLSTSRWIPWLLKGIGALVAHIGPSSKIAVGNISRNPKRVAATGTALLIGVTLVSCLGTGAASAKQTMANALDSRYSVDVEIITGKADQESLEKVRKVKGVKAADIVGSYQLAIVKPQGDLTEAMKNSKNAINIYALKPGQSKELMNVDQEALLQGGPKIATPEKMLESSTYKPGQQISVSPWQMDNNNEQKRSNFQLVSGSYSGLAGPYGLYGICLEDQTKQIGRPDQYEIWVKSDGTQPARTFLEDIREATSNSEHASVTGAIAEKDQYEQMINVVLMVMVGLLAVAVVIALIGVANTLSLSVIERTRESATLRAIGMTKRQLKRSLSVEALLIALGSTLAGLVLGTLFGWTGAYIVFESFGKVALPLDWTMYALIVLIAGLAAWLASVLPARRATKTPPVEALAEA